VTNPIYVKFFQEFGIEDVSSIGGKNASLGEMYQKLSDKGVLIPNGYDHRRGLPLHARRDRGREGSSRGA
jgi:hypothetical protein